jgi:hypothetical protein
MPKSCAGNWASASGSELFEVRGVAMPRIQDLSRATGLMAALRQGGLTQAPQMFLEGRVGNAATWMEASWIIMKQEIEQVTSHISHEIKYL